MKKIMKYNFILKSFVVHENMYVNLHFSVYFSLDIVWCLLLLSLQYFRHIMLSHSNNFVT